MVENAVNKTIGICRISKYIIVPLEKSTPFAYIIFISMDTKQKQTLTNRKRLILGRIHGSDVAETEFINSISLKCSKTVQASIVKKLPNSNFKLKTAEDSFANAISPGILGPVRL